MMYSFLKTCALIATVFYVIWIILFLKYRHKYDELIESIDDNIFTLKEVYFLGLGVLEAYENVTGRRITEGEKAAKSLRDMAIIFGEESAELYYYVYRSATISLVLSLVPAGLLLGCSLGSSLGFVLGLVGSFVLVYSVSSSISASVESQKNSIIDEFPQMVSKLTMLINAGMLVRRAWDVVANSNYEYPIYREMRNASQDMLEGVTVEEAMASFASRCGVKEMRKFASIYVQAVNRGASESVESMKIMADEAWNEKKQLAKQKGEMANQKLLIPNFIMFFGIILVVVVPMIISTFSNMSL